jgi:proton-translocating NADH-quinone oxidoreductase chain N
MSAQSAGQMQIGPDLLLLLPQLGTVVTGVLALIAEMLRRPVWGRWITLSGLLVAAALAVPRLGHVDTVFSGTFRVDELSTWAALILLPATALVVAFAAEQVGGTDREGSVYALLAFTTTGALVLAGAGDVLFLILGVLISSLGAFALVGYVRDDRGTEAALKYFVFGSVSEGVMVFGLSYWFGTTGSTLLSDLGRLENARLPAIAGLLGALVGLGYKAALAPFHFWAPDAYDGAPVSVAAYLSVVPKVGALFGLAQIARNLPEGQPDWRLILALLAALSMTYGNLTALVQSRIVRLLAYSSIAQAGYLLMGVLALGRSELAIPSLVVFGAAYAAMNLGAFAVLARVGTEIDALVGFGRVSGWGGATLVVFLLSLVGVPPLAGFVGKLLLFGAAIDAGYTWLAVVAILNSVLSLGVYLRLIVPMYQGQSGLRRLSGVGAVAFISLVLTIGLGLAAEVLVRQAA